MTNSFMKTPDGQDLLFFLPNFHMRDTYECIEAAMIQEYTSDAF